MLPIIDAKSEFLLHVLTSVQWHHQYRDYLPYNVEIQVYLDGLNNRDHDQQSPRFF